MKPQLVGTLFITFTSISLRKLEKEFVFPVYIFCFSSYFFLAQYKISKYFVSSASKIENIKNKFTIDFAFKSYNTVSCYRHFISLPSVRCWTLGLNYAELKTSNCILAFLLD